jgi:flavodoxin I
MKKILVLYYSRTGNTEKMANAVAQGAQINDSINVELSFHVEPREFSSFDAVIVGAPTYHHEMPVDFKNLFEELAVQGISLKGKIGAAFGSYGWSGEAPKLILELVKKNSKWKWMSLHCLQTMFLTTGCLTLVKKWGKKFPKA